MTLRNEVLKLFHEGLQNNGRGGRDGHSFHLTFYYDPPKSAHFWCYVDSELTFAAKATNMIVQKVNFDSEFYGVRIRNN